MDMKHLITKVHDKAGDEELMQILLWWYDMSDMRTQQAQNATLINELRPCAKPAYITCSPYQASHGFGCGNSCGCGCA